ncbi:Nuclear envelope morphology protein 1 [Basidiobolus ranarum]|uniref:Nuclear envelope morphology protein 1 n=1 Tax=Basidiobolus ranarum TaxID=34480 RepID=A0ABR2WYB7_9FUNG
MEFHTLQAPTLNLLPLEAGLPHNSNFTESDRSAQNILNVFISLVHSFPTTEIFDSLLTSLSNHCRVLWTKDQETTAGFEKVKRKTLVLDMDETLIHSRLQEDVDSPAPFKINVPFENTDCIYYVYDRPHVCEFLATVAQWYDLVIFTASISDYADPIIDWLEREVKAKYPSSNPVIKSRYYRQHCTYYNGIFTKDLTQIECDLRDVALLDNSEFSFLINPENAIPIRSWTNDDENDLALHDLFAFLNALSHVEDVRSVLRSRSTSSGY